MNKLSISIIASMVLLAVSCSYYPVPIEVRVNLRDDTGFAIEGITCSLIRDSEELANAVSDSGGNCVLKTLKGDKDKYIYIDDFIAQLKIYAHDTDGLSNGGDFKDAEYQCKGIDDISDIIFVLKRK